MPPFSPDDVIDYMVTEALMVRVGHEDQEAQKAAEKQAEVDEFKKDKSALRAAVADRAPQGIPSTTT